MFRKRRINSDNDIDNESSHDLYDEINDNNNDGDSRFNEYNIDEDEFEDDYQYELEQAKADKKNKKKEFYVKGSELKEEIRKHQESKKNSPDGKGKISEELRINDFKNMYKIFNAPSF